MSQTIALTKAGRAYRFRAEFRPPSRPAFRRQRRGAEAIMSLPKESREEAIDRLNSSASDLEARNARKLSHEAAGQAAAGQAWKILADLFGGVFVGLAIGFLVDRFADTTPWGVIGGVLLGFAVSVWMAWRTAQRLMAEANQYGEPKSVPFDDDAED